MSAGLFTFVSTAIEAVYDGKTLRRQHASEIDLIRQNHIDDVARINMTHADDLARLNDVHRDDVAALRRDLSTADRRITAQADEIGDLRRQTLVMLPDGQSRPLREMVSETTERVSTVATRSAARNIATMPGEGIPLIGIAVVVAATGLEIKDACEISTAMYELDLAMNPESAKQNDVCGMEVYTADEIWALIVESPATVWASMVATYDGLPTLSSMWDWVVETLKATPSQMKTLILWVWSLIPQMDWPDWDWPTWNDINPFAEDAP